MNPLTRQDILEHQAKVPWPAIEQVEQDLLLCRCMKAIFQDKFLRSQVAMRGGTLLHKVRLAPAARYSEDIDLVVVGKRPEGHVKKGLVRVLEDVLGKPLTFSWDQVFLTLRNRVQPSRILRLNYEVPPAAALAPLAVKIEANVNERQSFLPLQEDRFEFDFRGEHHVVPIIGYDLAELLGTKMRALFQRDKGRDVFDLYWALLHSNPAVITANVIKAFEHYLRREKTVPRRGDFLRALDHRMANRGFRQDIIPLLRRGITFNIDEARTVVQERLLNQLPE
jgi:predicted nucleotidyltransferase component of viral defense system